MDLDNSVETIMHYLLIEEMTCLNRWDGFSMVSVLVYVVHIRQDLWRIMM